MWRIRSGKLLRCGTVSVPQLCISAFLQMVGVDGSGWSLGGGGVLVAVHCLVSYMGNRLLESVLELFLLVVLSGV